MAEVLALSWFAFKALDKLAEYFVDGAGGVVCSWSKTLQDLTSSIEYKAITGMHEDLREDRTALAASISAVHATQVKGTDAVLSLLGAQRVSQHHDRQYVELKKGLDALEDIWRGRYAKGNPKNVGLLETAYKSAESAARTPYGSLETRLQAYRIWVVASYMHEVMTRTPKDAKEEALYIVGRIFSDQGVLKICSNYAGCSHVADEPLGEEAEEAQVATVKTPRTGESGVASELSPVDAPIVMQFLLEIASSVSMLPPLDQDVSCKQVVEAGMNLGDDGQMELVGGEIVLGWDAPDAVKLAIGKYCASRGDVSHIYPTVSAVALSAWEKNKERLALDNFFRSMGGKEWITNDGWMEKDGELRHRYGVTVEDGHVTKICLATNSLEGCLQPDLADCEHLRELVLHDNNIFGAIPRRLQHLMDSNPRMIATGLPLLQGTEEEASAPHHSSRSASLSDVSSNAGRVPTRRFSSTSSFWSSRTSSRSGSSDIGEASDTNDSGVNPNRRNRKGGVVKRAMSFIKEATKSDAGAGSAPECTHCAGKSLRVGQDGLSIECPDCTQDA